MSKTRDLEKLVLDLVNDKSYRPIKPRVMADHLKLNDEDHRELKRTIKRLIKKGRLAWGPKHLVLKSDKRPRQNEVIGVFRRTSAGFGFVTPEDSTVTDRSDDIYIPKQKTHDAADGDVVLIRVSRRRQGADVRISGRVVDVVQRRTHRFVGTYHERGGYGIVTVDNGVFESGIYVGDAGAKNCRIGDKVVIEMAAFPSRRQDGEGVIVEVLGDRGKPGVDTLMIMREFDLPDDFSDAVLQDAREQADAFNETDLEGRTDFTNATVITIDPKEARDFDDAISLERIEKGHWRLSVHIADVSHFVRPKSELDHEAFRRGTSVYLPDRVIPMLPEVISNNLASLQPGRPRFTMTAVIEFNADGVPISTDLHRGVIKSAHRFNYKEIDDYLADDRPWKKRLSPDVFRLVREMHTLAMLLRQRRMKRGAIDLALPDVKIELDDDGRVCGARTEENTESHQVIEEFMLAANEAVAQRLIDEELFLLRRIHEPPSEAKLRELTTFVRQLGIDCDSLQSRYEIKRVVALSDEMPERHAIHFAVLRSMQKAVYSPREIGHYALNSDAYCHFTSPIRRYPDLVIHRMIGDLIAGRRPKSDFNQLASMGKKCSDLERRAEQAERELIKLKLLNFLAERVGQRLSAVVTGVEPFGLFAQGIELPAEGLIPISNLPDDSYHFDRAARTLSGYQGGNEFRLGDAVEVRVSMVDPDRRQLEFRLVNAAKQSSARKKKKRRSAKSENKKSSRAASNGRRPRKHK